VRLTGPVFVSAETVVNVAFDVARARLARLLGAALDRAGLRLVALATLREFVNRVGEAVADPAEVRAREVSSNGAVRWSRIPLVPGEA
jgi:hypothetical protein